VIRFWEKDVLKDVQSCASVVIGAMAEELTGETEFEGTEIDEA
jgi:hypothetical protein